MKLLQDLITSGVLVPPFREMTVDQHIELLTKVDPAAKAANKMFGLSVAYNPEDGHKFWLIDGQGFLCAVNSIEALVIFLVAQAQQGAARGLMEGGVPQPVAPPVRQEVVDVGDPARARAAALRDAMLERQGRGIRTSSQPMRELDDSGTAASLINLGAPKFKELDNNL